MSDYPSKDDMRIILEQIAAAQAAKAEAHRQQRRKRLIELARFVTDVLFLAFCVILVLGLLAITLWPPR